MNNRGKRQLSTNGSAWGPQRVALGLSLRQLEQLSGINRGVLSLAEAGRLVPTGEEYQAVMKALEAFRDGNAA